MKIDRVRALEILDSRGNPTVEAEVMLAGGMRATAQVPSGASTGRHEAVELRDGDAGRYGGQGRAAGRAQHRRSAGAGGGGARCRGSEHAGRAPDRNRRQRGEGRLGANAVLAVSCAVARVAAAQSRVPLWKYLAQARRIRTADLPVPMVNIISGGLHAGGLHAGRCPEFQDFLVIPRGYADLAAALEAIVRRASNGAAAPAKGWR